MKVNLGGERLGAGNKMEAELSAFNRSTFNLSYIWRSTMAAGTLVPCGTFVGLPGDTWDIKMNFEALTHPTAGPLFGSHKLQVDVFTGDWRLYNSHLHNNTLGIGLKIADVKLPVIEYNVAPPAATFNPYTDDVDNCQINPSSINAYLGLRGYGWVDGATVRQRTFQCIPYLVYADAYKNYYANKQEGVGAVIHSPLPDLVNTVDVIQGWDALSSSYKTIDEGNTGGQLPVTVYNRFKITWTGTAPILKQIIFNTYRS